MVPIDSKRSLFIVDVHSSLESLIRKQTALNPQQPLVFKTYGALINQPYGCLMRNVIIAVYEYGVDHVCIVAEICSGIKPAPTINWRKKLLGNNITEDTIRTIEYLPDLPDSLDAWLAGDDCPESNVKKGVKMIRSHPLIPKFIHVGGWVMDRNTGQLVNVS